MKTSHSFKIIILVIASFVISYLTSKIPIGGVDIFSVSFSTTGYETIPKGLPFAFTEVSKVHRIDIPAVNECLDFLCLGAKLSAFLLDIIFWGFLIYFLMRLIKRVKSENK